MNLNRIEKRIGSFLIHASDDNLSEEDFEIIRQNILNSIAKGVMNTKNFLKGNTNLSKEDICNIKEKVTNLKSLSKLLLKSRAEINEEVNLLNRNVESVKNALSGKLESWEYRKPLVEKAINILGKHPNNKSNYVDKLFLYFSDYIIDFLESLDEVDTVFELICRLKNMGLRDEELDDFYKRVIELKHSLNIRKIDISEQFTDLSSKYIYAWYTSEEFKDSLKDPNVTETVLKMAGLNFLEFIAGVPLLEYIAKFYPEKAWLSLVIYMIMVASLNVTVGNKLDDPIKEQEDLNSKKQNEFDSFRTDREKRIALRK